MQDQDHVYKTKTKTSIYVLEEPRDEDHGLEDYYTLVNCILTMTTIFKVRTEDVLEMFKTIQAFWSDQQNW